MTQYNMLESPKGPDPKRLLLAIVLTSAVLMLYSYFFPPTPNTAQTIAQKEEKKDAVVEKVETAPDIVMEKHQDATPALPVKQAVFLVKEKKHQGLYERTSYKAEVVNIGGVLSTFSLTDFSDPRIIIDQEHLGSSLMQVSCKTPLLAVDAPYETLAQDESSITLRHVTKEGLALVRHYQFLENATVKEKLTFKNLSLMPLKVEPLFTAKKADEKGSEPGFLNPGVDGQYIAIKTEKYQRISYADLKDKSQVFSSMTYVAFDEQFFLAAITPSYKDKIENIAISVQDESERKKMATIDIRLQPFILMTNEEKSFEHQFFMGPKQVDLLSSFTTPLDENIDFGWFGVLSRPMLWLLVQIFIFVKNYGLAIIIFTFIIKLLTYPLTKKSFLSGQEMKKWQPKMKELQSKYGHDRTLLGQKQMEFYKTHGINPMASCLPVLIQLPIWFAFFQMLRNSVELFDQPFYWWITDLTRPDPYLVLPVLMGVTMLIQQTLTPPPSEQPHMKYVMWAMPIFLTFIMLNMPSGLSLYLLTNNLLTIGQQLIIKKRAENQTT